MKIAKVLFLGAVFFSAQLIASERVPAEGSVFAKDIALLAEYRAVRALLRGGDFEKTFVSTCACLYEKEQCPAVLKKHLEALGPGMSDVKNRAALRTFARHVFSGRFPWRTVATAAGVAGVGLSAFLISRKMRKQDVVT